MKTKAKTKKHSPLPWSIHPEQRAHILGGKEKCVSTGSAYFVIANCNTPAPSSAMCNANAAFIVTACNSHAANLARIAELESILRRVSIALQSNAITDGFTVDALNSDINVALKGTK